MLSKVAHIHNLLHGTYLLISGTNKLQLKSDEYRLSFRWSCVFTRHLCATRSYAKPLDSSFDIGKVLAIVEANVPCVPAS